MYNICVLLNIKPGDIAWNHRLLFTLEVLPKDLRLVDKKTDALVY